MRILKLTQGYETFVDDDVAEALAILGWTDCWFASVERNGVYAKANLPGGNLVRLHRFILGAPDGVMVDHRSRNTLDNQKHNLRRASRSQNTANSVKTSSATGYRGVSLDSNGRFRARIKIEGRAVALGTYATAVEASVSYGTARAALFGEFAPIGY